MHCQRPPGQFSTHDQHIVTEKINAVERGAAYLLTKVRLLGTACVQWVKGYDKGVAQAKSQHKLAVLDFFADNCPWCDEMDRKTFTDPSVVKLSKQFVMVKVDAMRERRVTIDAGAGKVSISVP